MEKHTHSQTRLNDRESYHQEKQISGENDITTNLHPKDFVCIQEEPLNLQKLYDMVSAPEAGAISTFSGTTRNTFDGKKVIRLEYESYIPMAEKELKKICSLIRTKWNVIGIAIYHRIGVVPIGESSVIIVISSAHRHDSLEAVQFGIDELKATVPIWKKEVYEDNSHIWKENKECCFAHKV